MPLDAIVRVVSLFFEGQFDLVILAFLQRVRYAVDDLEYDVKLGKHRYH